jgi:hypothetical protein
MTSFGIFKNPTVTGGVSYTPVNLNFNSNNTLDATCYHSNDGASLLTCSGGSNLYTYRTNGPMTVSIDLHDSIILGTNSTLGIRVKATNTGTLIRVNIIMHETIE